MQKKVENAVSSRRYECEDFWPKTLPAMESRPSFLRGGAGERDRIPTPPNNNNNNNNNNLFRMSDGRPLMPPSAYAVEPERATRTAQGQDDATRESHFGRSRDKTSASGDGSDS